MRRIWLWAACIVATTLWGVWSEGCNSSSSPSPTMEGGGASDTATPDAAPADAAPLDAMTMDAAGGGG
jgi:hypothetical protein